MTHEEDLALVVAEVITHAVVAVDHLSRAAGRVFSVVGRRDVFDGEDYDCTIASIVEFVYRRTNAWRLRTVPAR